MPLRSLLLSVATGASAYAGLTHLVTGPRRRLDPTYVAVGAAALAAAAGTAVLGASHARYIGPIAFVVLIAAMGWALTGAIRRPEHQVARHSRRVEEGLRRRVEELDRLHEVAQTTSRETETVAALRLVLGTAGALLRVPVAVVRMSAEDADSATVFRWHAADMSESAAARAYAILDRITTTPPSNHELADPRANVLVADLTTGAGIEGALLLLRPQPAYFSARERRLAEIIAADIAHLAVRSRLLQAVRDAATAEERRRIARELHDTVTQTLYSACMIADALSRTSESDPTAERHAVRQVRGLMLGALAELRALLLELRPAGIESRTFARLLHERADAFTARSHIPVDVVVTGEPDASAQARVAIYRIVGELLANVARHAEATRVGLHLNAMPDGGGQLEVVDDGHGFDPDAVTPEHHGLDVARERLFGVGGSLVITTQNGGGTRIVVEWPGQPAATRPGSGLGFADQSRDAA